MLGTRDRTTFRAPNAATALLALVIAITTTAAATTAATASETQSEVSPRLPSPVTTLYFAEGYTGPGFEEYLTIQNPNPATANVEVTYQTGSGQSITTNRQVAANSRATINVNAEVGPNQEVSARVESNQVIFAERPMYFTYKGAITDGHVAAGQQSLGTTFYFAEGYTGPGFDQYLTIQNPGATPATVNIEYQTSTGAEIESTHTVAPTSRHTVNVNAEVGPNQEVSTKITSTQPILAERPMYFTYNGTITGGHVVPGQSSPATTFYFAEGYTGPGFDEYLTLQNPNPVEADIEVTYQTASGSPLIKAHTVSPESRYTINVNAEVGPNQEVSTKITSTQPILAERPMYFTYSGAITGGHVVAGQTNGLMTQYFAEGYTGPGFAEYLTFQNTSSTDARVTVRYQFPSGMTADTSLIVQAGKRRTLNVGDDLGTGIEVSARIASDQPIVVERPMYFAYKGDVTGGHVGAGVTGPAAAPEPYLSGSSRIHHRGIGPIRAGMPIDEAAQLGGFAYTWGYDIRGNGSCLYAYPTGFELAFMVSFGQIVRSDIYPPSSHLTLTSLGIGSSEGAIYAAYPNRVTSSPHTYAPGGEYLDIAPGIPTEPGHLIRFNTSASNIVTSYQSGLDGDVRYVEGCA